VETTTGKLVAAQLIGDDPRWDLAVLKAEIAAPKIARFRKPVALADGARTLVVGFPTRKLPSIRPQMTPGSYLATKVVDTGSPYFQMKSAVRPGNSGGPVLDESGNVIGVVVAQLNTPEVFKKTGELVLDLGFAIPNGAVFGLLAKHGVGYQSAADGPVHSNDEIFALARPFVVRIGCWR